MRTLYHGHRNKAIEMLQEELFFNGVYILVYGEYKTAHDLVDCECIICGYTWVITPNSLLCNKGCKNCSGTLTLTLDQQQEDLRKIGKDFILTGEYENQHSLINCHCNTCGHSRTVSAAALRKGACPGCSGKVKHTIKSLEKTLEQEKRNITIISKSYVSKDSPLEFQCRTCLHKWKTSAGNVFNAGTNCSECALTGLKLSRPCNLYYLRITRNGEIAFKIGITGKINSMKRYHSETKAKIELLYEFRFETGKEAKFVEQTILKTYKKYSYSGESLLDYTGSSEMFLCDVLQMGHLIPKVVKNAK